MTKRILIGMLLLAGWVSGQTLPPPPIVPTPPAPAPTKSNPEKTYGVDNGRAWRTWNVVQKMYFLVGYSHALLSHPGWLMIPADARSNQPLADPNCWPCYMFPGKYTTGEVVEMIDKFFEEPENRPLQVGDALEVLAMRTNGMPREEVDKQIDLLRRVALLSY